MLGLTDWGTDVVVQYIEIKVEHTQTTKRLVGTSLVVILSRRQRLGPSRGNERDRMKNGSSVSVYSGRCQRTGES